MRISPLPPLPCLVAFEAAMRQGSFTRAAAELHLTQSAISRQVAQLERFLGKKLFVREPRALRLTVSGQRYAEQVQRLLVGCAEATEEVMKRKGPTELTVACSSGVAVLWLTPRLARFRAAHPDYHLRLIVNDSLASLSDTEFDIGMYYLRGGPPPGLSARRLYDEEVFPVCAPHYLNGRRLRPADLPGETLLMLEDGQRQWMSWQTWLAHNGVPDARSANAMVANQYPILLQLAMEGQGIALAWRHMIDACLREGLLVRACDAAASLGGGYYALWPQDRVETASARAFRNWLVRQSAAEG
ncbi:LysR substrate-binding domain-containing protein [Cupriavidus respiraculi]|uniref:Glycine cleavage system transcriptional activator n=1 Tax=Cupriavidus respiraculi TaxID=195930 RepID=A0ABN7YV39_9BURK|nr:LysR substrate-binding domain-containing protein [Cupriavidus respiraculi]MBY4949365.1 LysR family transcriptional regulator [Cupriavidus respiraculi]CAG9176729.1 Glycine cleavage system transcriptional activator [Cupriavidus respiraculi]